MVKCRIQTNPAKYKSIVTGFKVFTLYFPRLKKFLMWIVLQVSVAEEGMRGLVRGWAPTAIGYSAQVIQFCKPSLSSFLEIEILLGSLQVWIL
jgi:solute carrier family 25 phosphate transporter 3